MNSGTMKLKIFLSAVLLVVLLGCGKSKPNVIHVTAPLTYEETKAYLAIYDDAKNEQAAYNKKVESYVKFVRLMNTAHKFQDGSDFRVDDVNCHLTKTADVECERTIVSVPPAQATVPPTAPKETPHK